MSLYLPDEHSGHDTVRAEELPVFLLNRPAVQLVHRDTPVDTLLKRPVWQFGQTVELALMPNFPDAQLMHTVAPLDKGEPPFQAPGGKPPFTPKQRSSPQHEHLRRQRGNGLYVTLDLVYRPAAQTGHAEALLAKGKTFSKLPS